jgi:DNA-binding SARP family transcriptional activator
VLAMLLLRANRIVPTDVLVDALWGERPPRTATTSLHNSIGTLRRLLGADMLLTRAPGYRLAVEPDAIDLNRFEKLVAAARALEPEAQADPLREALALWRGDPLAEFRFEPWATEEIFRLEDLNVGVLADRIDADIACERWSELIPELRALVARHPGHERFWAQLMRCRAYSGRAPDAGATFQAAHRALVEEGLEPSSALRDLQKEILNDDLPRPKRPAAAKGEAHFSQVAEALLSAKLVPVLGTDVGELAEQLARRFDYSEEARELTRIAQSVALTQGPGPLYEEVQAFLELAAAPTPVHRFFASLPSMLRDSGQPHQLLVTTSYDLALERALLDVGEDFDVVSYVASGRDRGRFCHRDPSGETHVIERPNRYATELSLERRTIILKLHGGIAPAPDHEFGGVVMTEDDYIGYLPHGEVGGAIPVALAAKLRRSHFLFLGYGMREWGLRLVLDRMCAGQPLEWRSWAVLPDVRPLERELWRSRDIELFELPLEEYVTALGRYVDADRVETPA